MSTRNKEKRTAKAKGRQAARKSKGNGKDGDVTPLKPNLRLAETEVLRIQNTNLKLQRWNAETRALRSQLTEVERLGKEAQVEQDRIVLAINKRLKVDIRQFQIEDDGRLIPQPRGPIPVVPSSAPPAPEGLPDGRGGELDS